MLSEKEIVPSNNEYNFNLVLSNIDTSFKQINKIDTVLLPFLFCFLKKIQIVLQVYVLEVYIVRMHSLLTTGFSEITKTL